MNLLRRPSCHSVVFLPFKPPLSRARTRLPPERTGTVGPVGPPQGLDTTGKLPAPPKSLGLPGGPKLAPWRVQGQRQMTDHDPTCVWGHFGVQPIARCSSQRAMGPLSSNQLRQQENRACREAFPERKTPKTWWLHVHRRCFAAKTPTCSVPYQ